MGAFKTAVVIAGCGFLFIVGIFALGWAIEGNDFAMYKAFAPKYEQARRETFEQSKAYNQGMIQELQDMQFAYIKASADQKLAMRSIILHRVADYDMDRLPPSLRTFVESLRNQQEMGQ